MSILSTTRIETAVLSSQDFFAFTPSTFDASFTSLAYFASEIPERGAGVVPNAEIWWGGPALNDLEDLLREEIAARRRREGG